MVICFALSPSPTRRRMRKSDLLAQPSKKPVMNRLNESAMVERCPDCNAVLEQYDDDTIGLCVVVLATYIHREPSLATPMLLKSLIAVSRYNIVEFCSFLSFRDSLFVLLFVFKVLHFLTALLFTRDARGY